MQRYPKVYHYFRGKWSSPTDSRFLKVSTITSLYKVLWAGSRHSHSSGVKSMNTSLKVTCSWNENTFHQRALRRVPAVAAAAKSPQSCLTLCNPIDGLPPGSPVSGILQARTLEWVAISFSNAWKWKVKVQSLGRVRLLATSRTAAYQGPPSMGFSRQEYWSGVPLPSPEEGS